MPKLAQLLNQFVIFTLNLLYLLIVALLIQPRSQLGGEVGEVSSFWLKADMRFLPWLPLSVALFSMRRLEKTVSAVLFLDVGGQW